MGTKSFGEQKGETYKPTFIHFVCQFLGCSWRDALRTVCGDEARYSFTRKAVTEVELEVLIDLPTGCLPLWDSEHPQMSRMLHSWLNSRGMSAADVERHRIHHLGAEVIWPYFEDGILVYWQSRSRLDKKFRFPPSSAGVGKGDFLYGFDEIEPTTHVVITEAIFDKLALRHQSVATGGAILTDKQLSLIRALGPRDGVILAPDNDTAGRASVSANGKKLKAKGHRVYYSLPPELPYTIDGEERTTKDWNELGQYVVGWDEVPTLMERGIRLLSDREMLTLNLSALSK